VGRSDRRLGPSDLPDGGGQQRAREGVVPDQHIALDLEQRRVSGDVQLQVHVQLVVSSQSSVFSSQFEGPARKRRPFVFPTSPQSLIPNPRLRVRKPLALSHFLGKIKDLEGDVKRRPSVWLSGFAMVALLTGACGGGSTPPPA